MNLQGRNLSLNMRGPDVTLLQQELRELKYAIPQTEVHFGKATRTAVLALQQLERFQPTGIVDQRTAAAINRLVDQLRGSGSIAGGVKADAGNPVEGAKVEVAGTNLSGLTSAQGQYQLENVPSGPVTLRASFAGHQPQKAVIVVEGGRTLVQDFILKKADAGQVVWSVRGRALKFPATPTPGVKLVAYQVAGSESKELGNAVSSENGDYEIKYTPSSTPVHLRVKAFAAGGQEIGDSGIQKDVLPSQSGVDVLVVASGRAGRIVGRVVRSDGTPVAGVEITIQSQGIRKRAALGTVTTNEGGRFLFEYQRLPGAIDLRVELVPDPAKGIKETKPKLIGGAGEEEQVEFVVNDETYRGPSFVERVRHVVEPILGAEGIALADLGDFDPSEIALLASKTGVEPRELVLLKQSAALAKATNLPAEILHGLGRQKMLLSLPALLAQDPENRRAAVERALANNDIPKRLEQDARKALAQLDELTVAEALKKPVTPGETTLAALLDVAGLADGKQKKLVTAYVSHTGTTDEFWKSVRESGDLTSGEVDKAQFALQLGAVTQNHAPLVKVLQGRGVSDLKTLATFSKSDWLDLINRDVGGQPVGMPPDLKAAGLSVEDYADILFKVVEDAFPSAMVAYRIGDFPDPQPLKTFFERNAAFDIRTTPVRAYLEKNPNALDFADTADQKDKLEKRLKGLERTYRIAPHGARVQTMNALLKDGVDSAHKIRTMGRGAFVRRYEKALGGPLQAELVYARANHASALAVTLLARHSALLDSAPIHVLPKRAETLRRFSGYETLFGSLDFCACEHCQSVYSPAAYLVDVLHWLYNRPSEQAGKTILHQLFDNRRGDIGTIELSCKNTNTPLPYIDIVNEVLELAVAGVALPSLPATGPSIWQPQVLGQQPPAGPGGYQTTGSPADLLVHPEHLHRAAYEVLAGAKVGDGKDAMYPFNLPFNLSLEEARTYLGQLGVLRQRLMEVLHSNGRDAALTDLEVATEALRLSKLERQIIAGEALNPVRTPADFWGMSGDANWVDKLKKVAFFLEKATPPLAERGMQFEELAHLLRSRFVQVPKPVAVWFENAMCATSTATLVDLSTDWLNRSHRFIRLMRRLGWTTQELDLAIQVLGGGTGLRGGSLTADLLVKLSHVQQLRGDLHVPLTEMLTWWGQLDTRRWKDRLKHGRPVAVPLNTAGFGQVYDESLTPQPAESDDESFYDRVFQSRSVNAEGNQLFGVKPGGDELLDETKEITEDTSLVVGPLKITGDELSKLLGRLSDTKLSLANLSALYRHVSLARALNLTIEQLVSLLALTGMNPFDPNHTVDTVRFVGEVNAVRESGFTIEQLDYLLRHVDTKPATLEPQDKDIAVVLRELGDDLRKVESDNQLPAIPTPADELRALIELKLSVVVAADELAAALAIIDPQPQVPGLGDDAQRDFIDQHFGTFLNAADAKTQLVGGAQLADRSARLLYVLERLLQYLRRTGSDNAVIQKIADSLGLGPGTTAGVLRSYIRHPSKVGVPGLEVFRNAIAFQPSADKPLPDPTDLVAQFSTYRRLHKVALTLHSFRIRLDELSWVFEYGPQQGTLDFDVLSISASNNAGPAYLGWARLRDAIVLRDTLTTGKLLDLFEGASSFTATGDAAAVAAAQEALLTELEKRTRWNKADLRFLAGAAGFNFSYPDDWKDERSVKRLAEAMAVIRRIGLPAERLWAWRVVPDLDNVDAQATQAEGIKQAVRSRYEEAEWRTVARSLRDRLREQQRDGLVGWLLGYPSSWGSAAAPWKVDPNAPRPDANDLFSHFLLDVEMSPCQPTSRVKQAISSTQLFIQRALMNLEEGVILSTDDAREWKWMKNYRVWEANRKVFLYPENWIEPELRDDKTPLFKELESKLRQDEVTDESAEQAFRAYLEDLDDVARLEIVGLYHEQELVRIEDAGRIRPVDILHVFGRTRSTPSTYYYRRHVDSAYWTPWEKVDVDIEGDHLLPVVYNRRLYVFWAQITEAALEEVPDTPSGGGNRTQDKPKRYYQIRLGWSERRNGKWSKKKLSPMQIGGRPEDYGRLNPGLPKTDGSSRSDFFFRAYTDAGDLIVEAVRCVREAGDGTADQYIRLDRFRLSGCDGTLTLEANPGRVIHGEVVLHGPDAGLLYRTTLTGENWPAGRKAYFFKGDQYIRYDIDGEEVDKNPRAIVGHWPVWPASFTPIDAAVAFPMGRAYFFKGDQYIRYNMFGDEVDLGPRNIAGNWPGWPPDFTPIDAALQWPGNKVYFFKGDQYIRFDIADDQVDLGPRSILAHWTGWPADFTPIDAAVLWPDGKAYFFKGDKYIRFDIPTDKVDKGPTNILGNWGGWPASFITSETVGGGIVPEEITIRRPNDTSTANQGFARAAGDGGLSLPAQNPATGAFTNQPALAKTPSPFEIHPLKLDDFRSASTFFYQDLKRTFFVEPHDAYGWVRQPPNWTIPGAIPIDLVRLLPELYSSRPVPPWPDPWVYEGGALVKDPSPIDETVIAKGSSAGPGGLLHIGVARLGDMFGPQIAYMAGEPVTVKPNKVAVGSTATVLDEGGGELLALRSAMLRAEDTVQRTLVMNTSFYLPPSTVDVVKTGLLLKAWDGKQYRFNTFYHPYLCTMIRELNRFGIDELLDPKPSPVGLRRQRLEDDFFEATYAPIAVDQPFPKDDFDFSYGGAYSIYNWELFFHAPFLMAVHLSKNRRFEDAHRWFHYVFDPTESSSEDAPQRFWKVRPFYELFYGEDVEAGPIHELFLLLHDTSSDPERIRAREQLIEQVDQWRTNPFNPHAIARLRLTAYQKAVVMKYLDNLIEWGDQLFRRDTMESINEASQLYVLAAQILGRRPQRVPVEEPKCKTFNQLLTEGLDEFSNAAVEEVEGYLPEISNRLLDANGDDISVVGPTLFFCVPPNDKLIVDYWDRVADRLFKVRHCMNIEGVVRQLPLFEPPIDPALLVRAAALGVDLSSALSDLNAPLPRHRYRVLSQKATELCADVRALGAAMLAALEKKDAEALALLRAGHEVQLQSAIQQVREKQIEEAKETLEGLNRSKENAEIRLNYYRTKRQQFMIVGERLHQQKLVNARDKEKAAQSEDQTAADLGMLPDLNIGVSGFGGSAHLTASFGSSQLVQLYRSKALRRRGEAAEFTFEAQAAQILASYERRADDWGLQGDTAEKEIQALDRQIVAAEIRVALAEMELDNLKLQLENSQEAERFLRDKYTNEDLYQWMVGQISSLYFQSYQLAVDLAKRAERAWQFELAAPDKSFIQFGYWDSLKRGLLAGERLHYDLKRMEAAYLDGQRREYELTRHVSVRMLDPVALVQLREEGECFVRIPEAWFDLDTPGHFLRRIKTIAVTLPCVTGPYVPVRCTLTLLRSEVRTSADPGPPYARKSDDSRFCDDPVALQSIVTSRAQEDSGLFETNLGDERYLPFEGAGTISEWRIMLPKQFAQFDYNTISDLILHIRYTAREGGDILRQAAVGELQSAFNEALLGEARTGLFGLFSAKHEFSTELHRFLYPLETQVVQTLDFNLGIERFPFPFAQRGIQVKALTLYLQLREGLAYADAQPLAVDAKEKKDGGSQYPGKQFKAQGSSVKDLPQIELFKAANRTLSGWSIEVKRDQIPDWLRIKRADGTDEVTKINGQDMYRLNPDAIDDMVAVMQYAVA